MSKGIWVNLGKRARQTFKVTRDENEEFKGSEQSNRQKKPEAFGQGVGRLSGKEKGRLACKKERRTKIHLWFKGKLNQ